jgi:hypothetical protein
MIRKAVLRTWLEAHPFDGRAAFLVGIVAVGIPTALRASVDGIVTGVPMTGYVPFILISAVLLGWWNASLVALASATLGDLLFVGPPNQLLEGPADMFVVGLFLFVSGVLIGFVELVRKLISDSGRPIAAGEVTGIIFSLENGQAWASWSGSGAPVRLGPEAEVAEMMQDFLAQLELGRRLTSQYA